LQQALFARLTADSELLALLGGTRVYDDVPQSADFPYLTFGQMAARDWSTASGLGEEHTVTLHVWSQAKSRAEVHEILSAVRTAHPTRAPPPPAPRLITLRHETSEARRDPSGDTYHGLARFRAVTEPT